MKIGQVASASGVGVETVRYYERRGLIAEPPRRASGYRSYPPHAVERIRFIRRAKELGFSLREIRELLQLRVDPDCTCATIRGRAKAKIADVESRIRELEVMRRALVEITRQCDGDGPGSECPILDAIAGNDAFGSPASAPDPARDSATRHSRPSGGS